MPEGKIFYVMDINLLKPSHPIALWLTASFSSLDKHCSRQWVIANISCVSTAATALVFSLWQPIASLCWSHTHSNPFGWIQFSLTDQSGAEGVQKMQRSRRKHTKKQAQASRRSAAIVNFETSYSVHLNLGSSADFARHITALIPTCAPAHFMNSYFPLPSLHTRLFLK